MTIPKPGTAVLITWLDSTTEHGWKYKTPKRPVKPSVRKIRTLAWIVGASATALAVANTISHPQEAELLEGHLNPFSIPLGCILDIVEVPTP